MFATLLKNLSFKKEGEALPALYDKKRSIVGQAGEVFIEQKGTTMSLSRKQRYLATRKVTLIGGAANAGLAITKVLFGWLGHSSALFADGIHSFSDLLSDVLVIFAAKFAYHEADAEHPYGHERMETVAAVALSVLVIFVGILLIVDAIRGIWLQETQHIPHIYVLWVALFSVVVNEVVYRYTKQVAIRIKSDMLYANALDSRSDAVSSLIVLIGVAGSLFGVVWFDKVAAILVGAMIIKMGVIISWQNISELIDTGVDLETLEKIRRHILCIPGVQAIHQLRTRKMAGQILIDVHVIVPSRISVSEGHHIGDQVLGSLHHNIDNIRDIVVHVDSEDDELYAKSASLPARSELLPELRAAWSDLPGVNDIKDTVLHYHEGKIEVSLILPLSLLRDGQDAKTLRDAYQHATTTFADVKKVKLLFT